MDRESSARSQSLPGHRSESKKRGSLEIEEKPENSQKRVKMRNLESVFLSEAQAGIGRSNTAHPDVYPDSRALDQNVDVGSVNCMVGDDDPTCFYESNNPPTSGKEDVQRNDGLANTRGFDLDLNAADISSSINDPWYPYKMNDNLRSSYDSDCGSSVGPLDKRDPMIVWKGLKQNNYMSTSYGDVPMAIPKARGKKKSNNDIMKKKIELAKKEQVDRFARVAAPSGLLNGLNPGIINHVRNSKQVHSIIEALVRSERNENLLPARKRCSQIKIDSQELPERKEPEYVRYSGVNTSAHSCGDALLGRRQASVYALFPKSIYPNNDVATDGGPYMGYARTFSRVTSQFANKNEDDKLPLKLSSSVTIASDNASCLSNDISVNPNSVTSLSLRAANVASQWLELLNQDIRGRLAALRRSKKRVRAVITTELPLLLSREFSSNLGKDVNTVCHFNRENADAHSNKWSILFEQMDKALSDEESHLENWLNQVKEMQLNCEMGLNKNTLHHPSQRLGPLGNRSGATNNIEKDLSEKDLAVKAAAASIYSTCSFLLSRENLPCR